MRYLTTLVGAALAAGCLAHGVPHFSALAGPARHGDLAALQRLLASRVDLQLAKGM